MAVPKSEEAKDEELTDAPQTEEQSAEAPVVEVANNENE
jgi:hypothetical protein